MKGGLSRPVTVLPRPRSEVAVHEEMVSAPAVVVAAMACGASAAAVRPVCEVQDPFHADARHELLPAPAQPPHQKSAPGCSPRKCRASKRVIGMITGLWDLAAPRTAVWTSRLSSSKPMSVLPMSDPCQMSASGVARAVACWNIRE